MIVDRLNDLHVLDCLVVDREGSIKPAREVLTLSQRVVDRYAAAIFSLGRELTYTLQGQEIPRPINFCSHLMTALRMAVSDSPLVGSFGIGQRW